ncbi:MAG TPA: glycosyltransferase [Ilumatobacteraceae bacterium]|nr:glycosyltransferase [Ilumatobacteraceae bacterium]
MRVLHVITKGDVGGAQTHVVELAAEQHRRGTTVHVAAGCDGPAMDRLREAGIEVTILDHLGHSIAPRADRAAVRSIRSLIRTLQPDVVHAHSSKGGLLARLAARREKVPSVYTAHGFPFQAGAPFVQRVMSLAGEWVGGHVGGAVICLTPQEAALARRWHIASSAAIHVVPNGLPDTTAQRVAVVGRPPRIVMVARFAPPKRQQDLIDVLARLADLSWEMVFVGDGPMLAAAQQAASSLGERVRFLGHRDDVQALLADCDVAVLWSGYEGMPIALMEAMRAGLCCVASDLPGVRALFGEPPAGLTAVDGNSLEHALRSVLTDTELLADSATAARRRFVDSFTIERMVDEIDAIYADLHAPA